MLPARTFSPPYFLIPRYLGFESRPFLDEPTPFLCAICQLLAEFNVLDADLGKSLPVALFARVVLATLELENDDFVVAALLDDFARNLGTFEGGDADAGGLSIGSEDYVVELYGSSGVTGE